MIEAAGSSLAAISVDTPEQSQALGQRLNLSYPLASDVGGALVRQWGLLNSAERGGIAYPATWVIDQNRRVGFRSLDKMVARVDPAPVIDYLRGETDPAGKPRLSLLVPDFATSVRTTVATVGGLFCGKGLGKD